MRRPLRLVNRHTGETLDLLRRPGAEGTILELKGTLPPKRQGPPRHIHHLEDEFGSVSAGVLSVEIGGVVREAGVGEALTLPRGVPHRWWNAGEELLRFEGHVSPIVDLDRYLQAVFEVVNAGPAGRPSLVYLAHIALRHRRTQSILLLPAALQWVLFRLAYAWGTLTGRYRGTEWPGCPARCPGAPTAGRG